MNIDKNCIGKYFYARYGLSVVCGECVSYDNNGLVLKFRWGTIFKILHYIPSYQIINEKI